MNTRDVLFGLPQRPPTIIEWGTVGWDDAELGYLDTGVDDSSVRALVTVQLFAGYRPGSIKNPATRRGHGVCVVCQIAWPLMTSPPPGAQVCVAFPGGDIETPGNGVIIAVVTNSPGRLATDRIVLSAPDHDVDITPKSECNIGGDGQSVTTVGAASSASAVATATDLQTILSAIATNLAGLGAPLSPTVLAKIGTSPAPPSFAASKLKSQ